MDKGKKRFSLPDSSSRAWPVRFSPDSQIISNDLKLWDVWTREELANLRPRKEGPLNSSVCFSPDSSVCFSPDGLFLIEEHWPKDSHNQRIHLWDVKLKKEIGESQGRFGGMARDGDVTILAIIIDENQEKPGKVILWRLGPRKPPSLDRTIPISVNSIALSDDGRQLVTAGQPEDGKSTEFALWDTVTGVKSVAFNDQVSDLYRISWLAKIKVLFVESKSFHSSSRFETSFWDLTSSPKKTKTFSSLTTLSPYGQWVAVPCANGATLYKVPTMTNQGNLIHRNDLPSPPPFYPYEYYFSPDGHFLLVTNLRPTGTVLPWWWPGWSLVFGPPLLTLLHGFGTPKRSKNE